LPESIGKFGDVLLFDFVSAARGAMLRPGLLMLVLCLQVRLVGVLKDLSGGFMSGQVIFFSMLPGARTTGMGSQVTVLSSYLL
jgi:hypothetical protein